MAPCPMEVRGAAYRAAHQPQPAVLECVAGAGAEAGARPAALRNLAHVPPHGCEMRMWYYHSRWLSALITLITWRPLSTGPAKGRRWSQRRHLVPTCLLKAPFLVAEITRHPGALCEPLWRDKTWVRPSRLPGQQVAFGSRHNHVAHVTFIRDAKGHVVEVVGAGETEWSEQWGGSTVGE